MSDFKELTGRAAEIREQYRLVERKQGKEWTAEDHALGFVGDVGELMQLVGAKKGVRHIDNVDAKLEHELADCLYSIMTLAKDYDIDLEAAFVRTMDELAVRIAKELAA